jgi:hypothetical protein
MATADHLEVHLATRVHVSPTALAKATPQNPLTLGPEVAAWRSPDGDVILSDQYGDITVPASMLRHLAEGLLSVHVHNGRPDVKAAQR